MRVTLNRSNCIGAINLPAFNALFNVSQYQNAKWQPNTINTPTRETNRRVESSFLFYYQLIYDILEKRNCRSRFFPKTHKTGIFFRKENSEIDLWCARRHVVPSWLSKILFRTFEYISRKSDITNVCIGGNVLCLWNKKRTKSSKQNENFSPYIIWIVDKF